MKNFSKDEIEEIRMSLEEEDDQRDKDQINDPYEGAFLNEKENYEDLEITEEDNIGRYYISKNQCQSENSQSKTKSTDSITNINLVKKEENTKLNTPLEGYYSSRDKGQEKIQCEAVFPNSKENNEEEYGIIEKDNKTKKTIPNLNPVKKDLNANETPEKNNFKKPNLNSKNSRKIFDISKVNKKVGRMLKKLKKKLKAAHNKYSEDNIIRKFKARFQDILLNYINYEYSKFLETKGKFKKIKILQRINPNESRKIGKADNLRWFSTKLKDLFSSDLSQKCSLYDSNYNKCTIENLYKNNEALNVINILEKEVIDLYDLYRNNVKIDGFTTLEDDLKMLREKLEKENEEEEEEEDIELYLSNYRNIAMKLDEIFDKKKGRNKKKSKKNSL
jgi:hypothetical protein